MTTTTPPPRKQAPNVPKPGKGSQTKRPDAAGTVLPVENPMDLWYLCQKAGFAEQFPMRDARGRALCQRQVSRWVHYDCKGSFWQWPYWGEVGFDMLPDGGRPPEAIMSRREPFRPSTMPLSRYEIIRRRVAFQAGIDAGTLPWVQIGLAEPLVTTAYLEENLSPDEVREAYRLVRSADTGWDWTTLDRPKIPGLLRIPDVIRLRDYKGRTGSARFVADNIAYLIEIKFEGDVLTDEQTRAYYKIVNGEINKFRLLETKVCKTPRRRREWLEKARKAEPVFRTVEGGVTSPERLKEFHAQLPQSALLLHDMEAEQQAVRRVFGGGARRIDDHRYLAELRSYDPTGAEREEAERRRLREQLTLILGAPLAGAAAGTALAGAGALAGAAGELGGAVELVRHGAQTLARFPIGKVAVTAAAANAAIYNAAAQTPPASDSVAPRMTQDAVRMLDMLNHNATVRVLYLAD